ncbi:MAG: Ca-activated chloride channel family protein, partial [Gammaproteobacteria bacterium]
MRTRPSFFNALYQCVCETIRVGLFITALLTCIVLTLVNVAHAEVSHQEEHGDIQTVKHPGEMTSGGLLFKADNEYQRAPILHTDVSITITGMIARAKVKQSFRNPTNEWKEGVYVFPLPESATVDQMRMHIGERIIEGQIREKETARKEYKAAKKAGKKASLVEQERPSIFTTSLANIGPQETIVVEIEYQQVIKYDLGEFSLRFPTVVAPRYIPGNTYIAGFSGDGWANNTDEVADAARITPPVRHPDSGKINPLSIHIDLDPGFKTEAISSPYHKINIEQGSKVGNYTISLCENTMPANRDFLLNWKAVGSTTPQAALFRENKNNDEYALLMILPPKKQQDLILKREIIFVIDTSGSMAGTSIVQAKSALQLALSRLKSGDRFNIIQFNSYTSQLFNVPVELTTHSLQQAQNYISALQANGGTEMASAIRAALNNQSSTQALRQVVFLTDGSVGNEEALFTEIEQLLG